MDEYGERLRRERHRLRLTQHVFAKTVGVSQGSQVGYESGATIPNIEYLARAASIGVDSSYVLFGKGKLLVGLDAIDWVVHDGIAAAIDAWLNENQISWSVERKMQFTRLLLPRFVHIEEVDGKTIGEALKPFVS